MNFSYEDFSKLWGDLLLPIGIFHRINHRELSLSLRRQWYAFLFRVLSWGNRWVYKIPKWDQLRPRWFKASRWLFWVGIASMLSRHSHLPLWLVPWCHLMVERELIVTWVFIAKQLKASRTLACGLDRSNRSCSARGPLLKCLAAPVI